MTTSMTDPNAQHDSCGSPRQPVTSWLHPGVYAILVGFTAWFGIAVWSFAGSGVVDYLLAIVCGIVFVAVALPLILSRVGHPSASSRDKEPSLREWAAWDYDTWAGRLSGAQAATQILLPMAAAAMGMTVIGIIFRVTA